jgi:hypothetical protein
VLSEEMAARQEASVDRSRKATREGTEATLKHMSPKEALLIEELVEEKLAQLQASLEQLRGTPEFQRRAKALSECQRTEDETSGQFYDRLRRWLERDIPPTKSPLHPPRQVENRG